MQLGAAAQGPVPGAQNFPPGHIVLTPAEQQYPLGQSELQSVYPSTLHLPSGQAVATELEVLLYPAGVGRQRPDCPEEGWYKDGWAQAIGLMLICSTGQTLPAGQGEHEELPAAEYY